MREEHTSPHGSIWIHRALRKACFFAWLVTRSVLLITKKIEIEEDHLCWCFMCNNLGEDVNHLVLRCND